MTPGAIAMNWQDIVWLAVLLSLPLAALVAGGLWAIHATRSRRGR